MRKEIANYPLTQVAKDQSAARPAHSKELSRQLSMKLRKPNARWKARTRHDLIIEVWEALDCESVGTPELEQIQQALREKFGDGGLESPASIARTVTDEGAVLRHPEVFQCDSKWRERFISDLPVESLSFANLREAADSIRKLEFWRAKFTDEGKQGELRRLQEFAIKTKQELLLMERSRVVEVKRRLEAAEIGQWLTIWMQNPALFDDWLHLRQLSAEFVEKFSDQAADQ